MPFNGFCVCLHSYFVSTYRSLILLTEYIAMYRLIPSSKQSSL